MKFKTLILKDTSLDYLKTSFKLGRRWLITQHYKECPNPNYLEKNGKFIHYNKILKAWVREN